MVIIPLRQFEEKIQDKIEEWGASASRTGIWIRDHLKEKPDYIWSMFRRYRAFAEQVPFQPGSYASFRNMIYVLKQLKLIEEDHKEPSDQKGFQERIYYRLIQMNYASPAWDRPFGAYKDRPSKS